MSLGDSGACSWRLSCSRRHPCQKARSTQLLPSRLTKRCGMACPTARDTSSGPFLVVDEFDCSVDADALGVVGTCLIGMPKQPGPLSHLTHLLDTSMIFYRSLAFCAAGFEHNGSPLHCPTVEFGRQHHIIFASMDGWLQPPAGTPFGHSSRRISISVEDCSDSAFCSALFSFLSQQS